MAARLSKHHSETVRQKIQASVIIDRFHKHHMGTLDLTQTQIKAGEILLDRSVAKLTNIQHSGDEDHPVVVTWQK